MACRMLIVRYDISRERHLQGKDFAIWIFAALMVLSPMALAATMNRYHGELPVQAAAPVKP